ncbi:MAG: hypothetical protein ACRES7_04195 [Gammaproteobacteria bacterium]
MALPVLFVFLIVAEVLCGRALAATPSEPPPPYSPPYLPTDASQVLQNGLPSKSDPEVRKMEALRVKHDAHPDDLKTALALSQIYVTYGRGIGDAHYAGYAEVAIAPWLRQTPPLPDVLIMHATILQYLHKFSAAQVELEKALARDPGNANGWLTRAFTAMVQGQFDVANQSCVHLTQSGGPFLGLVCTATLRSFTGHAEQAYAILKMDQGGGPKVPASIKSWIQSLLAESAERLGESAQAEQHFKQALAFQPGDNFLLVNYADFLLDQGRPQDVIKLLGNYAQSDTAFLRIALAKQALHSPDLARYTWIMAARFAALQMRGDTIYGREHSRFVLHMEHDPEGALKLAERNWTVQRAPWDARVYLEAALAAGKPEAAQPVLDFLDQTKLQDPIIDKLAQRARTELQKKKVAQR